MSTATATHPLISAIIVSYNTRQMTLDCLRSLYDDLGDIPNEVFVVDNASADGSVDAIRAAYPQVRVIANTKNVGFGYANNQAMKIAQGEYFLLLNTDAFPRPGAIPALLKHLRENPHLGTVGPRLFYGDGKPQVSCFPFPSPARAWMENLWISALFPNHPTLGDYRRWKADTPRIVDFIIGACMLLRREAYEKVGGFDERFFMYSEETDWQKRMKDAGWPVGFTPSAEVVHLAGGSGANERARINRHFFSSLDYYEYKHHGLVGLVLLRLAMTLGSLLRLPLWMGVLIVQPSQRDKAKSKVKLNAWLIWRQLTCWRL
jgi:GT2 family glycosyltransferase